MSPGACLGAGWLNPVIPRILSPTARHPHTYTTHSVNPPAGSWEPPLLGEEIGAHSKEQGAPKAQILPTKTGCSDGRHKWRAAHPLSGLGAQTCLANSKVWYRQVRLAPPRLSSTSLGIRGSVFQALPAICSSSRP